MPTRTNRRNIVIALVVAVVVAAVAIPWAYVTFVSDPPERLTLDDGDGTGGDGDEPAAAGDGGDEAALDGTWTVGAGSVAGYRVPETLVGQSTEAVGRTEDVTGELVVVGTTVEEGTFTVDLNTVTSDDDRRDNQFRGRIMDVANHPEATFTLTEPLELDVVPAEGEVVPVTASGELTARGTTRPVEVSMEARRTGDAIETSGTIPVVFADFGIPDPSFGPAVVGPEGEIEFRLVLTRQ